MPPALRDEYAYIPNSITNGFSMGPLSLPSSTHFHKNHYKEDRQSSIDNWLSKSLEAGFIAGPFDPAQVEAEIGPIHASPLQIVDKHDANGRIIKERIVYDASYPKTRPGQPPPPIPSINSQIRKEDYPCEWFTAVETKILIRSAPPHARFAGFDLKDAFQQLGNLPSQRRLFCINVLDRIYVWLVGIFGLTSICGLFGACCDVTCFFLELLFPLLLTKHYVDDFLVADFAPPSSPHANRPFDLILHAVREFGWEVHPEKFFSWTRQFTFLGFVWDADSRSATLTQKKQTKFLGKLIALNNSHDVSEKEVASVIGSCQHVCVIATHRRSKLNALYRLRNSFIGSHSATRRYLDTASKREVVDWIHFFQAGPVTCSLDTSSSFFHTPVFSDASDFALGVVLGSKALSIPLPPDYCDRPDINIGVGEAWAFELAVHAAIAAGARSCVLLVHVDNQGVVYALRRGRSRNQLVNEVIDRTSEYALSFDVELSGRTIRQAFKNISLDPLNLRRPIRIDDFKAMRAHMDPHVY
ncbi:unnamed protein product [Tilletia caries]|nr:unnamed protein product [Tilletia caries]